MAGPAFRVLGSNSGAAPEEASANASAVDVENVNRVYGAGEQTVYALSEVSLSVQKGEFVGIVGPSGCGKSTLLRIIAGLTRPTSGSVRINSEEVRAPRNEVGLMFQTPTLFEWRTVARNITLPLEVKRDTEVDRANRVQELLELVGLDGLGERLPRELSGGMQQRVALCRLLVSNPELMLLDEPFGALDEFTREKLNIEIASIIEQRRRTAILVTHNISEAVFLSDRVLVMGSNPGRALGIIDVDLPRPRTQEMLASPEHLEYVRAVRKGLGLI